MTSKEMYESSIRYNRYIKLIKIGIAYATTKDRVIIKDKKNSTIILRNK